MSKQFDNNKYDGIQALRFFAAILVVVTHSTFYAKERLGADGSIWDIGAKGVDIFFVISGFVMVISSRYFVGSRNDWKIFINKRLVRIVPLYWIATTFKLTVLLLMSSVVLHAELDWWYIFKSYLFIPSENIDGEIKPFLGVGWTLIFELFFYLVFTTALFFRKNIYVFVGGVLLVFSAASFFRGENYSPYWFLMDSIILEFYMGMFIGYFTLKKKYLPTSFSLIAFFLSLAYILFTVDALQLPRFLENGVPAAILVWSIISLERYLQGRVPRMIMFFGSASYTLYLFHPLIIPVVPEILKRLSLGSFTISVICSIIVSMIASALIHRWIELPCTSVISNYKNRSVEKQKNESEKGFIKQILNKD